MKTIYCEYSEMSVIEENGKFGLEDKSGHLLLPMEYDKILSVKVGGFVLSKNGRIGYVEFSDRERLMEDEYGVVLGDPNGCAQAFLPCIYDWVDAKRNGLALYSESEKDAKDLWFDYKSRTLYRNMRWVENFGDFDALLDLSNSSLMPELKRAGEDAWVRFPKDSSADPWRDIPLDTVGVRCILCMEEIVNEDDEDGGTVDGYEYFFLLLYKNGWTPTRAKRSLAELYAELPAIMEGIKNRKNGKEESKQGYTLLCKYKKRNEEWG